MENFVNVTTQDGSPCEFVLRTLHHFIVACEVLIYFMGVSAHDFVGYGSVMAWNILTCSLLLTYFTTLFETA